MSTSPKDDPTRDRFSTADSSHSSEASHGSRTSTAAAAATKFVKAAADGDLPQVCWLKNAYDNGPAFQNL